MNRNEYEAVNSETTIYQQLVENTSTRNWLPLSAKKAPYM